MAVAATCMLRMQEWRCFKMKKRSKIIFGVLVILLVVFLFPKKIGQTESISFSGREECSCYGITYERAPYGMERAKDIPHYIYCIGIPLKECKCSYTLLDSNRGEHKIDVDCNVPNTNHIYGNITSIKEVSANKYALYIETMTDDCILKKEEIIAGTFLEKPEMGKVYVTTLISFDLNKTFWLSNYLEEKINETKSLYSCRGINDK